MESNISPDETKTSLPVMKMFMGSYDGKVYSLDIDLKSKKTIGSFAFKVSEHSLKVIVNKDSHIFASGIDEIIHIFDMEKRQDKGMVVTYAGSIDNIQITKKFLFASGSENNISIWRMSDFNLVHSLKGHKAPVTHFIIHKSAKFGISASKDSTLIIWNLVTGTKIIKYMFKDNLVCNKILFMNKQTLAVLLFDSEFWIFDLFKKSENYEDWIVKKVKVSGRIVDAFSYKTGLYILDNNGEMKIFADVLNSEEFAELLLEKPEKKSEEDLDIRVKIVNTALSKKIKLLNIIYSNHEIYVFDFNKIIKKSISTEKQTIKKYMQVEFKTSDRITCLNTVI